MLGGFQTMQVPQVHRGGRAAPQGNSVWTLVIPAHAEIDLEFVERCAEIVKDGDGGVDLFTGAGMYPYRLGLAQTRRVSFCFDFVNSPTHSGGTYPVVEILPAPFVVKSQLLENLRRENLNSFKELVRELNDQIALGKLAAVAHSGLFFGSQNQVRFPKCPRKVRQIPRGHQAHGTSLTVVTRTDGTRDQMLRKNIESVDKFILDMEPIRVRHVVVSSARNGRNYDGSNRETISVESADGGTRFGGLLTGIQAAKGDFIWFLDDDDCLSAKAGPVLENFLSFDSTQRMIYVDAIHVHNLHKASRRGHKFGHVYKAVNGIESFGGPNKTPLCSVIYPITALRYKFDSAEVSPKLLEDQFLLAQTQINVSAQPVFIEETLALISIHGENQSVTSENRSEWRLAMDNLRESFFSGSSASRTQMFLDVANIRRAQSRKSWLVGALKITGSIFSPRAWRTLIGFGVLKGLRTGRFRVSDILKKYLRH